MKKLIFLLGFLFTSSFLICQNSDDVLMTVGTETVSVAEFQYIYEKNNGDKADYSESSLDEYLDLYKKFKLKVAEAKDMKLDTIEALQKELAGYREQLANSYLMDKEVMNNLYKEIYDRMDWDVRLAHILVKVPKKASEEDVMAAKKKANGFFEQIDKGSSFEDVAKDYSEDKLSAKKGGDIGYYTAMMPNGFYELENAMYNTKVGEVSKPVKSKLGFHILKVLERRPAKGKVSVSQILIRKKKEENFLQARTKIDEVYEKLGEGEKFEDLVREYSEDKKTKSSGGALPVFGIRAYSQKFEDVAFGLDKVGDFSEPFESKIGWHILYKKEDVNKDAFEIFKRKLEPKVKKDERYEYAKQELIKDIKANAGYQLNQIVLDTFISKLGDDFYTYKWRAKKGNYQNETLFSFGSDLAVPLKSFVKYCKKNTRTRLRSKDSQNKEDIIQELLTEYVNDEALKYEQLNLEKRYPDFKSLMREYEEGILLFEATKLSVWDKANEDTLGLYEFYEKHSNNYQWDERVLVSKYIIHSKDKELGKEIHKYIKKKSPEEVLEKFNKEEELIEYSTVKLNRASKELAGMDRDKGSISRLAGDDRTNLQMVRKIEEIIPAQRKTLEEARGYIVADYQIELEKNWLNELKRKFPIEINKKVYKKLKK